MHVVDQLLKDACAHQELFMNKVSSTAVTVIIGMAFLTGCQHLDEYSVNDKMATVKASQTQTVVNINCLLYTSPSPRD